MPDWILKGLDIPLRRVSPSPEVIGTCLKLVGLRNTIVVHQSSNKDRLPIPRGCRWDHPVQDQEMVGGLCPAQQRGDQNMESNFKHYCPVFFSPREASRPGLPRAEARPETGSVTEGCRLCCSSSRCQLPAPAFPPPPADVLRCPYKIPSHLSFSLFWSCRSQEKEGGEDNGGGFIPLLAPTLHSVNKAAVTEHQVLAIASATCLAGPPS